MHVDTVHILDDMIEYLKTLKRRAEELECIGLGMTLRRKLTQHTSEKTCDNHGDNKLQIGERPVVKKRKALEIDDTKISINYDDNLFVCIEDKEVVIEMKCRWREGLLLEIVNTASNLQLDCHSVQSSTDDGILSLVMKSKVRIPRENNDPSS